MLRFDPDDVDQDLVVLCASPGPGHADVGMRAGDRVDVDDDTGRPLRAIVLRRTGHDVLVRILQPHPIVVNALREVLWPDLAQIRQRRLN